MPSLERESQPSCASVCVCVCVGMCTCVRRWGFGWEKSVKEEIHTFIVIRNRSIYYTVGSWYVSCL